MNAPLALLQQIREQHMAAEERHVMSAQRALDQVAMAASKAIQALAGAQGRLQTLRSPACGMVSVAMNQAMVASSQALVERLKQEAMAAVKACQTAEANLVARKNQLQRCRRATSRLETWHELDAARLSVTRQGAQALLEEEWSRAQHAP